jgi:MFS family permease
MRKMTWLFGAIGFLLAGYYATWQANLLARGFEFHQIGALIALATTLSMAIDIPTSIFADRIGHKLTVLLGISIYALGFLVPALSSSAFAVVGAVIIIAIGDALLEGALDSWTADIQKAELSEIKNHHYMSLDQSQRLGMILGAIAIPGISSLIGSPIQGSWLLYSLVAIIVCVFAKTLPTGQVVEHSAAKKASLPAFLSHARSPAVWPLILGAFIFGMADSTNQIAFWPKITELGFTAPVLLGMMQSGMSLSRLLGLQSWKASGKTERPWIAGVSLMASSVFFLIFALTSEPVLALVAWFLRIAILSAYYSALRGLIQRTFRDSQWRATASSGIGTVAQIGTILLASAIGAFGNSVTTATVCALGAILSLFAGLVFYLFSRADRSTA